MNAYPLVSKKINGVHFIKASIPRTIDPRLCPRTVKWGYVLASTQNLFCKCTTWAFQSNDKIMPNMTQQITQNQTKKRSCPFWSIYLFRKWILNRNFQSMNVRSIYQVWIIIKWNLGCCTEENITMQPQTSEDDLFKGYTYVKTKIHPYMHAYIKNLYQLENIKD